MRKLSLKLTVICGIMILSSCKTQTEIDKPEKIGTQVFSIIKEMQTTTKDGYLGSFLQIEELRELVNNKEFKIDGEIKNEIRLLTREEYYSSIKKEYNIIKGRAVGYGIEVAKITYLDFVYKTRQKGGLTVYEGILYFKYNDKIYQIESTSIDIGKKLGLTGIKDLRAK